ncbi:MAG: DUF2812 domain-containing protein [Tissierella sp.]|uniref:DUF2812 domain-containing protein n=1 Tax=Tissierella sp. TaxID=41274 RepID=UPI003F97E47F
MNFKIEINYLDIRNYPIVEKHFEDMAGQGWLIHKIIFESIFIYKKINPEELDFSIVPYQIETVFTKKRKSELEEFQTACESVGWNYASKSMDLHIYFKKKGSEALDLETDEEEEFKTLEKIGRKQNNIIYLVASVLFFLGVFMLRDFRSFGFNITYMDLMKDGFMQVAVIFLPLFLMLSINKVIRINGFINKNKENMELGKKIEYSNSKFYFEKTMNVFAFIVMILIIIDIIYIGLVLKNTRNLFASIPLLIGTIIGTVGRYFVKSARKSLAFKVIAVIAIIVVGATLIGILAPDLEKTVKKYNDLDINEYKVLSSDSFEYEEKLLQNASFLVPKSYEYAYLDNKGEYIKTEYAHALTEDIAETLVNQYIKSAKAESKRYQWSKKVSIERDKENLWNLEEVYFLDYSLLNHKKIEVLIREGKEVFYLEGKDFSDSDIIKTTKNRLDL